MSIQFLVTLLEWLQAQFVTASEKQEARVKDFAERIAVLKHEQAIAAQQSALATKLAGKIDDLLAS